MGQQLSETETLLWALGRDPNLASTMGLVAILDGRPDPDRMRATVAASVAAVERLRQRVAEPSIRGGLGRPEWVTDRFFDLDHHFRVLRTGRTGAGLEDLKRMAGQLVNDPFDEARPLWQFHLITGFRGGRSALVGKVHHSISDGIGLLRLAGNLLEFEADAPGPEPVDLQALLAAESEPPPADGGDGHGGPARLLDWLQHAPRLPGPGKVVGAGVGLVSTARAVTAQLPKSRASELWATRSHNRRLEFCTVPLDSIRETASGLGVTINDLFVAACGQAAVRYHRELEAELPRITATVVVSTETSDPDDPLGAGGDNAFIPVAIELPGDGATPEDRLEAVRTEVRARRDTLGRHPGAVSAVGTIGGLVPSGIAAALTLGQAARIDFATSNIAGPPVPTWLATRPVERIYPVGPVAGTAFNVTFMSYDREASMGLHVDPAAVIRPDLLARCLSAGFGDFGVRRR
jgi:WS/DGAT/MGAT family acyltransferase